LAFVLKLEQIKSTQRKPKRHSYMQSSSCTGLFMYTGRKKSVARHTIPMKVYAQSCDDLYKVVFRVSRP
jgi:hypothetical protein